MSNCKRSPAASCGWFMALLLAASLAGCGSGESGSPATAATAPAAAVLPGVAGTAGASATNPTVNSSSPSSGALNVPISSKGPSNSVTGTVLTATFSVPMNAATVTLVGTFTLKKTLAGTNVPGTVTMNTANTVATFTPNLPLTALDPDTSYTATVTTAAKTALPANTPITSTISWSFRTKAGAQTFSQLPVDLGAAGNFVIFSNTAVTSVFQSNVVGNIGTAGTGADTTIQCPELTAGGKIFSVDATYPDAACLTIDGPGVGVAAGNMAAAITDAKGRTIPDSVDDQTGLAGNISGLTLAPGLYKWNTGVLIDLTGVTITGGANDVWIFQISGNLTVNNGATITLGGSAQAKNIFWQVGGVAGAMIGSAVNFKGVILADTGITVDTASTVLGRLYSNPAITLKMNVITPPAP